MTLMVEERAGNWTDDTKERGLFIADRKVEEQDDLYLDLVAQAGAQLRQDIVEAMMASKQTFRFADFEAAAANITFRVRSIAIMTNMNTGLYDAALCSRETGCEPRIGATFPDTSALETEVRAGKPAWWLGHYWEPKAPEDPWGFHFCKRAEAKPSEAFDAESPQCLFPYRGNSAGGLQIALYLGVLTALGRQAFDAQLAEEALEIGSWTPGALPYVEILHHDSDPVPGDIFFMANHPDYVRHAPQGLWCGLYGLYVGQDCLGEARYTGLGSVRQREADLKATLRHAFCAVCPEEPPPELEQEIRIQEKGRLVLPSPSVAT